MPQVIDLNAEKWRTIEMLRGLGRDIGAGIQQARESKFRRERAEAEDVFREKQLGMQERRLGMEEDELARQQKEREMAAGTAMTKAEEQFGGTDIHGVMRQALAPHMKALQDANDAGDTASMIKIGDKIDSIYTQFTSKNVEQQLKSRYANDIEQAEKIREKDPDMAKDLEERADRWMNMLGKIHASTARAKAGKTTMNDETHAAYLRWKNGLEPQKGDDLLLNAWLEKQQSPAALTDFMMVNALRAGGKDTPFGDIEAKGEWKKPFKEAIRSWSTGEVQQQQPGAAVDQITTQEPAQVKAMRANQRIGPLMEDMTTQEVMQVLGPLIQQSGGKVTEAQIIQALQAAQGQ